MVIGLTLCREWNEAELWGGVMQITDHHAFEQIHPAECGASIREARISIEEVDGIGQLGGEARDLDDPFRGGRPPCAECGFRGIRASYLGELGKNVAALVEGHDDGSLPNAVTFVVVGRLGDSREGFLAGVVDQIASFQIGAGTVRAGKEGDQILVRAGDVGGCDSSA